MQRSQQGRDPIGSGNWPRSHALLAAVISLMMVSALTVVVAPSALAAACTGNEIVCENQLPGTPQSQWDVWRAGDSSIQGFATEISVNRGGTVDFKIKTDAADYSIEIYRLGYYQGNGARRIDTVSPSASLPQEQPACATDAATEIYDCGTWGVSASWSIPSTAVSGVYIARLVRADTGGDSHIPFIVRADDSTSTAVFQTSDTTWQAYNDYGGSNFYHGLANGRAYKVSYNRPFSDRGGDTQRDFLFSNEYPMIRFMESNGYDVSYISGLDTDVRGSSLAANHRVFLSVGHDEYWSAGQRTNVEKARDAGMNLAFFSGNEVYWKTRWEPSQDGSGTPNRTLVCYKDTWANSRIDPVEPTATWRDPRFGDNGHGPENALTGTAYVANHNDLPLTVSAEEGNLRLWRDSGLAGKPAGTTTELAPHIVGYESDEDLDNGFRPAGLVRLSTSTGYTPQYLRDYGNTVTAGTTTHHLTMYRAGSGALVFSAGTIQWGWGLDANHDGTAGNVDPRMQQATINILADMGASATSVMAGLTQAVKSTDSSPPTALITSPAPGFTAAQGSTVTVTGAASDAGGGQVAGVEVSLDSGASWHAADGRGAFTYTGVFSGDGQNAIQVRAIDDSANIQTSPTSLAVTAVCPCTILGDQIPVTPTTPDGSAVTLGMKFTTSASGFVTGVKFWKGAGNTGTHSGFLYKTNGTLLATATFTNETPDGWQTATFPSAIAVGAGETYTVAYRAPNGHYAADQQYFGYGPRRVGMLTAPGGSTPNGVFTNGSGMPTGTYRQTNYYVDVVYSKTDTTPISVTASTPESGSSSIPRGAGITATFSRAAQANSANITVVDSLGNNVSGTTGYDQPTNRVTLQPSEPLKDNETYTATATASAEGVGPMNAPATWTFKTARQDAQSGTCPCGLFNETDYPAVPAAGEVSNVELGIAFSSDASGSITGIRFFKGSGNSGQHTVSLWSTAGARLATANVVNESTTGWQEASFATPMSIVAGTTYIASYRAPVGRYAIQVSGLSSPRDRSPLHSPSNAGRYTYGSGAPLSSSASNYFVDPVFTASEGDAPNVTAISPGDQATSVPVSAKISVGFSTTVQPNTANIAVVDSNGLPVPGNMGTESLGSKASFVPSVTLAAGQRFTIAVSGARNLAGVPMAAPATFSFTTGGPLACPCSLFASSTSPILSDSADGRAVTVGLRFTPSADGTIVGIRYFRDAQNAGIHTGSLYTAAGVKLGSITYASGQPGWQTALFASPIAVKAGTAYVASTFMPQGHYSIATDFFSSPVVNVPLTGTTGTYTYGASESFPSASYRNSNYYVDVVFQTDMDQPTISTVTPANVTILAQPDAVASAKFAKSVDSTSIQIAAKDGLGNSVPVDTAYDSGTSTVQIRPSTAWPLGTSVILAVVGAKSTAGVAMTTPFEWQFTTVAAPPVGDQYSLFSASDLPVVPAYSDNGPVTVGMKFRSDSSGSATAVKFYAGPGNNGPYDIAIWSTGGVKLGAGRVVANASGWKTVVLDSPVALTAGTTYVASYRGASGRYSLTSNGLSAGRNVGPLHISAGGGAYSYANSYPSGTSNNNFFIDVVVVIAPPANLASTQSATTGASASGSTPSTSAATSSVAAPAASTTTAVAPPPVVTTSSPSPSSASAPTVSSTTTPSETSIVTLGP